MSTHSPDAVQNEASGPAPSKAVLEFLACNGCRKTKLRCSRDRPTCTHCRKTGLECVYETKRVKPGLKSGAIENLHRRIDAVEQLVLARDTACESITSTVNEHNNACLNGSRETTARDVLALLAKELPKLISSTESTPISSETTDRSWKRRRLNNDEVNTRDIESTDVLPLPGDDLLEAIVSAYFVHVHPWIPMIHQARFRQRMNDTTERKNLSVVLHSMALTASKFVPDHDISTRMLERTRRWVVSTAMETLSLENLQALIILAFTDIGDGNTKKAWSIIGSLTRTVEYCQLTQEHENSDHQPFCTPYESLQYTQDWTEIEERRRIFWNIFILDRFCSISMGWNTSLTSDDVHRRLPCDGHFWRKRTPVLTPYFGIWDKSASRVGKPIAFLPQYHSPAQAVNEVDLQSQTESASSGGQIQNQSTDMSTVGAFAYNIEATESMSRIMSYFLQQKINTRDQREINAWLTRFKELDLRLVHWKMFLPQKWKTNMERQSIQMDPNLTTAHITHNASLILLHQLIAYPPVTCGFQNRLPSTCSIDACFVASVEIATIIHNYLNNSENGSLVGNQITFCLFVAARILLVNWRHSEDPEPPEEFWSLVQNLEEISRRWTSSSKPHPDRKPLAFRYASMLRMLYEACQKNVCFSINVVDFNQDIDHGSTADGLGPHRAHVCSSRQNGIPPQVNRWASDVTNLREAMPAIDMAAPASLQSLMPSHVPLPLTASNIVNVNNEVNEVDTGDFNNIPHMTLDQHFVSNMDRVIAFDDGSKFAATLDHAAW